MKIIFDELLILGDELLSKIAEGLLKHLFNLAELRKVDRTQMTRIELIFADFRFSH